MSDRRLSPQRLLAAWWLGRGCGFGSGAEQPIEVERWHLRAECVVEGAHRVELSGAFMAALEVLAAPLELLSLELTTQMTFELELGSMFASFF
jgi:hypothetical protein